MQISKTSKFLSDWGFHVVLLAVTLPILGLAYLAWTALPAPGVSYAMPAPASVERPRSLDVIAAFRSAGLEAEIPDARPKDERDGVSLGMVVDARRFRISDKPGEMGLVMFFENRRDLVQMQNYYLALNRSLPRFRSWLFVQDNMLLQINGEVPEDTARAYADVLETVDQ